MAGTHLTQPASESVKTGALMPLVSFQKHYKISLTIFVVMALLAFPIAKLKGKAFYSVTGVIHVAPRVANILQESKEQDIPSYQQYQLFLGQQVSTIARYDIVLAALQKLGKKRFVWQLPGESDRKAAERLQGALAIKAVKDTYLLTVTLESDNPKSLEEIVNAVIDIYLKDNQIFYASGARVTFLNQQREKLLAIIAGKNKRLTDISQQLSLTNFLDNAPSPYDKLLSDSQMAFSTAQRARMEAEANLELFENTKAGKTTAALEATVSDIVSKDQGLYSLRENMYQRRSKLVEQISGLDPRHPGYGQIKKQLAAIEAEVVDATEQLSRDVKHMLLEDRHSKVTLTRQIERDMFNQIEEQKQQASWFSSKYKEALILNQDIKRFYEQLQTVESRISFIELESKSPGFVRIESYAKSPEDPIRGGRKKIFLMVLMMGAIIGLIVPILIDLLDKRIRTAGQVEKLLGYKPLAALMDPHQENVSHAMLTDQRRRLLLALNRQRLNSGKPSQLIVLTSVNHNSAVTSLAFDLANDSQRIDLPAIVLEVNAFKPDNRYPSAQHLSLHQLLSGSLEHLNEAIEPSNGEYPDRIAVGLPAGSLMANYQQLQIVLNQLAERYAFVFLDTAPILWSADSEFFVSISDISLLLIAAHQTEPGQITRTVRLLESIDPNAIGFIVTRLLMFKGGGYYAKMFNRIQVNNVINTHLQNTQKEIPMQATKLLYVLHSGNLYGTERMALATLAGLQKQLQPVLFAPAGLIHQAAQQMGIESHLFNGSKDLFKQLPAFLQGQQKVAFCATGVSHSLIFLVLNLRYRLPNVHLHLVHGGTDEKLSYGRKKWLNHLPVTLVAVSNFVKQRLLANGAAESQIEVVENFLPDQQIEAAPKRQAFTQAGIHNVLVISRIDPIKRIDLLLDALDSTPALQSLNIRILGTGWDLDSLRQRAFDNNPNVTFVGFSDQVEAELAKTDLLLHLCPEEPFGLAILEAMAAKVPVLLPDQGGASDLIPNLNFRLSICGLSVPVSPWSPSHSVANDDSAAGLHFHANDINDLANQLVALQAASAEQLNNMAENAYQHLWANYSAQARLPAYQQQFAKVIA